MDGGEETIESNSASITSTNNPLATHIQILLSVQ